MEYAFSEWSEWRLEQRLSEVMDTAEITHGPERREQINRELAHLTFELSYRKEEHGIAI